MRIITYASLIFTVNLYIVVSFVHNIRYQNKVLHMNINGYLDSVSSATTSIIFSVSAILSAIPLSVLSDKILQNGTARIEAIANIKITDEYGEVFAYISRPNVTKINDTRPVVFLVHQFFGLRPRDAELCDELARLGYIAVAPDCYQGNNTGLIPRAISLVSKAAYDDDFELPLRDFHRVSKYLQKQSWADMSSICVCGFCFGGGVALRYANRYPENIKACGIFYGKPIKSIDKLRTKVYGVFGSRDRQFPPTIVDAFETLLRSKNLEVEFRRYDGQNHAFIDDLACIKRGGDASDAWTGWIDILRKEIPV